MNSTMRSNLGIRLPIDILVVQTDTCVAEVDYRFEPGEPYLQVCAPAGRPHFVRPRFDSAPALSRLRRKLRKVKFYKGDMPWDVALHLPSVNRTS